MRKFILPAFIILLVTLSCRISYKFNGASIDYSVLKTIEIVEFQNQATLVYPPLMQVFNENLKEFYLRNTKLNLTKVNPDLELEGEITKYELTPLSVRADALASETRLTMTVRFRFRNNKNPKEDKEATLTAFRDFPSDKMLTDVQDQLVLELTRDIVDQMFNATMSNW